jgi:hypothetical protein
VIVLLPQKHRTASKFSPKTRNRCPNEEFRQRISLPQNLSTSAIPQQNEKKENEITNSVWRHAKQRRRTSRGEKKNQ